ncbi:MAG: NAD(P)-dependent alcohol dehydrogenase [Saprospiraceae bacterium]|nr:NAD(P)-dependent alcohol dehydrogenase [Saprospiraceae bacterium]
MKAFIYNQYGPPEVLQLKEVEKPTPKNNEVLIKIYAATVNRTDCGVLWGKPFIIRFFTGLSKPKMPTTGTDFAGVIEAVGKDVKSFKIGDKVLGFDDSGIGSHAEYITFPEHKAIIIIPDSITYEQAAASAEGAHYAYNFINKVNIKAGDNVMLNGATGAIGSAALQMLKAMDVRVTATCRAQHINVIKSLGADKVIDYEKEDFTKDNEKYHFVFDAVGKSTFGKCKPLLHRGGIYISSELGPGNQNPFLALITPLLGGKKVKFPIPFDPKKSLNIIKNLLEQGKFKPVIDDKKFAFEQVPEAFRYAASAQKLGNVVITIAKR